MHTLYASSMTGISESPWKEVPDALVGVGSMSGLREQFELVHREVEAWPDSMRQNSQNATDKKWTPILNLSSELNDFEITDSGAIFSKDRRYRYALWRLFSSNPKLVLFVMLNPSIADEVIDDPTQRRCRRFAQKWGFGGYYVANIFAYINTDPKVLKLQPDPVGPDNDAYLKRLASKCDLVVVAWGRGGKLNHRGEQVLKMLSEIKEVHYLKLCKDHKTPSHPLYLRAKLEPKILTVK